MVRAEAEIQWIQDNTNLWAGVYDVNYVLGNCQWSLNGNPFAMSDSQMRQFAADYLAHAHRGDNLVIDLRTENPNFPGRSQVKKIDLEKYKTELNRLNAIAEGLRNATDGWPGKGVEYDSIKGFCEYCNEHGISYPP